MSVMAMEPVYDEAMQLLFDEVKNKKSNCWQASVDIFNELSNESPWRDKLRFVCLLAPAADIKSLAVHYVIQMGGIGTANRKIVGDLKSVVFYVFAGIFVLNVFSGVTTEVINQFFAYFFGVRTGRESRALKQVSVKRLKHSAPKKPKKKPRSFKKPTRKKN